MEMKTRKSPFAGRLGGNQAFILDRDESSNATTLGRVPDAAPLMSLSELAEGLGSLLVVFTNIYWASSAAKLPAPFTDRFGPYDNAAFIGTTVGGLLSWAFVTLFILSFGAVSGGHLNPTITFGTFFGQLCTFSCFIIYIGFQTAGAALAGLLLRKALGSRDFKVGGCWLDTDLVPVSDAFVIEFMACSVLIFISFGVGLDPRQSKVIGPTLSRVLIGLTFAALSIGTGFTRYGYGGTSLNPARCFGAFMSSSFPGWHWINWFVRATPWSTLGRAITFYVFKLWHPTGRFGGGILELSLVIMLQFSKLVIG
ncbi:putative aquaporin transporter [Halenospora varia]|nr:putative aquaporin transporter [Halenospora varia]